MFLSLFGTSLQLNKCDPCLNTCFTPQDLDPRPDLHQITPIGVSVAILFDEITSKFLSKLKINTGTPVILMLKTDSWTQMTF